MTANDILSSVDLKEPNSYTREEKLSWLSALDGKVLQEVLLTHEGYNGTGGLAPYSGGDEELLIPFPYGEGIYTHYLIAMIAASNAEAARYNQQIAMYNACYSQWWNRYNAEHRPLSRPRFCF